jgi:serine/threonine protein kinase
MKKTLSLPKGYELTLGGTKYEIVKFLGLGGSSMVYSAMCNGDPVVVKELFPEELRGKLSRRNYEAGDMFVDIPPDCNELMAAYKGRADFEHRLLQEMRTKLKKNEHGEVRNVAADSWFKSYSEPIYSEETNTYYTIIGSADGDTLKDMLSYENKDDNFKSFTDICEQILRVLEALEPMHKHEKGAYLHLDIAPDNIWVLSQKIDDKRITNLIDFNSAYKMNTLEEKNRLFSIKEPYSAPELMALREKGTSDPDALKLEKSVDLYSVAVIFFEMLMGKTPIGSCYHAWSRNENVLMLSEDPCTHKYIESLFLRTAKKANEVLKKGLEYNAAKRYQSIGELRTDIKSLISDAEIKKKYELNAENSSRERVTKWKNTNAKIYELLYESDEYISMTVKDAETGDVYNSETFLSQLEANGCRHAVLVGDGGMGKTTTSLLILEKCLDKHEQAIYIPLSECSYSSEKFLQKSIKAAFSNEENRNSPLTNNDYEDLIAEEDIILLLDGFNEIANFDNEQAFFDELKELAQKKHIRILLTSRNDVYNVNQIGGFAHLQLEYISNEKISEWLSSHLPDGEKAAVPSGLPYEILGNPMLLKMYAIDIREQQFLSDAQKKGFLDKPTTAGEIIWNYLEHQIRKSKKLYEKNVKSKDFSAILLRHLLPYIAYRIEKQDSFNFTLLDLKGFLRDFQKDFAKNRDSSEAFSFFEEAFDGFFDNKYGAKYLVEQCLDVYCLLKTEEKSYTFTHQHFRDIFSATHIMNRMKLNDKSIFTERIFPFHISRMLSEILREHKYEKRG